MSKRKSHKSFEFDLDHDALSHLIPATRWLARKVALGRIRVAYKKKVWATHASYFPPQIQFGERTLRAVLEGYLSPCDRKLLSDRRRAFDIRDGHDMAASISVHEVAHLLADKDGFPHSHGAVYWKVDRQLFGTLCQKVGDVLRQGRATSPPSFLEPDPEVSRFRRCLWETGHYRGARAVRYLVSRAEWSDCISFV